MNKKLIISKTSIFIFVVLFINIFKGMFGDENTLIGVTVVTAMLMLLERDLTSSLGKNFLFILLLNLMQGIFAYIGSQNVFVGIIVNFIAMFIIAYTLTYNLRNPVYLPFGLQYIFILSKPITSVQLPMRLLSLAFGAAVIIISQVIVNRNKLKKSSEKVIIDICSVMEEKVELLKENREVLECDRRIVKLINNLKKIIYDSREDEVHVTNEGSVVINILFALERINILLNRESVKSNEKSLKDLNSLLENIKEYLISKKEIKAINIKSEKEYEEYYIAFNVLQEYIVKLEEVNKNRKKDAGNVPDTFKTKWREKEYFTKDSVVFCYAIRIGLLVSIFTAIVQYFNIPEGRWLVFSIFSIVQPYHENTIIKSKKRIQGTLVGAIIFMILFSIFKDVAIRGLIIIAVGYISSYLTDYRDTMITTTVSALGAAAMTGAMPIYLTINRLLFVALGILIAIYANKYILPYDAKKGKKYLISVYEEVANFIAIEVKNFTKGEKNSQLINSLFLISALIEDRLIMLDPIVDIKNETKYINSLKASINFSYGEYILIKNKKLVI